MEKRKKPDVCREFGLINSMFQMICKNRTKIISVFEQNKQRMKQFCKPEQSEVDAVLLKWF